MTIGERIRIARKDAGLTQKALGAKCQMPDSQIRQYELGMVKPKLEQIQRIANALNVNANVLLEDIAPASKEELVKNEIIDIIKKLNISVNTIEFNENPAIVITDAVEKRRKYIHAYDSLNSSGQDKAIEQVELLTKIPEYRKDKNE